MPGIMPAPVAGHAAIVHRLYTLPATQGRLSLMTEVGAIHAFRCRKMIRNLLWATGYNTFAVPLIGGVGVVLRYAFGAALMSVSTVTVAVNARLLGRFRASRKASGKFEGSTTQET